MRGVNLLGCDVSMRTSRRVTRARLTEKEKATEDSAQQRSAIRSQQPVILSDFDKKYVGQKISRGELESYSDDSENDVANDEVDDSLVDDNEMEIDDGFEGSDASPVQHSEDDGNSEANSSEEATVETFKKKIKRKYRDPPHLSDDEDDVNEDMYSDVSDQRYSEDNDEVEGRGDDIEEDEDEEEDDSPRKFSKSNVNDEVQKGMALRSQLGLWDSLLESRIKLQKLVTCVNQMPNPEQWNSFIAEGGDAFSQEAGAAQSSLKTLVDKLTELQTLLLVEYPETQTIVSGGATSIKNKSISESDEEITSDSDLETETEYPKPKMAKISFQKPDDYTTFLEDRFQGFKNFRNSAIQKWYDKTRFASGKLSSKSYSSLEQSALKQIEQIMSDKSRLIKRSQLQRSVYRILGSTEEKEDNPDSAVELLPESQTDVKNYNAEIFDDDDFYHQLLRQLIEKKTSEIDDPVALSRQWLEIQKIRNKVKKKVDRRASKGRKLRYHVHKKMVNFMAQEDKSSWTDEAKNDLFKSLFVS